MRRIKLHDPNGRMIYCNVTRFFGVNINGREQLVINYDEVAGLTNRYYVVVKEGNTLRLKPFNNSEEYNQFLDACRQTRVREFDVDDLPVDLYFCQSALKSNSPNLRINPALGNGPRPYIDYVEPSRSLTRNKPIEGMGHITSRYTTPSVGVKQAERVVTKYAPPEPTPVREVTYREKVVTKYAPPPMEPVISVGYGTTSSAVCKYAPPAPQPVVTVGRTTVSGTVCKYAPPPPTTITKVERWLDGEDLIEELYERIPDFEDYYSFFGIEEMRGMTYEEIFFSEKMMHIARVLKQGARDGDPVALSLFEFYDGFKEDLKRGLTKK